MGVWGVEGCIGVCRMQRGANLSTTQLREQLHPRDPLSQI